MTLGKPSVSSGVTPQAAHTSSPGPLPGAGSGKGTSEWLNHFLLLSLLRPVDTPDGNTSPLPRIVATPLYLDLVHPASEKPPRYVALGGGDGNVAVFSTRGAHALDIITGSTSPVTALASYALRRNESVLVTGHADGEVRSHTLFLQGSGDRIPGISRTQLRHVLAPGEEAHPVTHLLPVRSSYRVNGRRTLAAWDESGWLRVARENGTVRLTAAANTSLLACTSSGALLICASATHILVHKQHMSRRYLSYPCTGLNGTARMVAAAFDPARAHRAYAVTSSGLLLVLNIPHEKKTGGCKVVRSHPLTFLDTWAAGEAGLTHQGVSLAALRGYLVVSHTAGAALLNVSLPRMPTASDAPLVEERWDALAGLLGLPEPSLSALLQLPRPWLGCSAVGSGLLLMGLPGGALAVLEGEMYIPEPLRQSQALPGPAPWTRFIFFGFMLVVGFWQFTKARNRAAHRGPSAMSMSRRGDAGVLERLMGMGAGSGDGTGSTAGLPPDKAAAYRRALQRLEASRAAVANPRGGAVGGRPVAAGSYAAYGGAGRDGDAEEEDILGSGGVAQAWAARSGGVQAPQQQYRALSGFAGPRSLRRAMRMGIAPIAEVREEDGVATGGGEESGDDGGEIQLDDSPHPTHVT